MNHLLDLDDEEGLDHGALTDDGMGDDLGFSFVSPAITDGSQTLLHDGYDVQAWLEAAAQYDRLEPMVEQLRGRLSTALPLCRDLFWSFYQQSPVQQPVTPLTAAYGLNARTVDEVMSTGEWRDLRASGTPGDLLLSAMATIATVERALAALPAETVEQANALHAAELGMDDLFQQAGALESLAEQTEGDRAQQLYEQAQAAREEAARQQAEAEQLAEQLAEQVEEAGDAIRKQSRQAMQQVGGQIEDMQAAVRAFGGGYGPSLGGPGGPGQMTTKDKIALAQQVGKSRRLKEIAAIAGRMVFTALEKQQTRTVFPPTEIDGVEMGHDLIRVLPSEIALLASPGLDLEFYRRYAEGQLQQFALYGVEPQGQGPVMLAIDGSGSMSGQKEVWSKGVMLALQAICKLQGRDLVVLHFSSAGQLAEFRFPKGEGSYQELIRCSEHFFGGGTDFEPFMERMLEINRESAFTRADAIVITDGLTSINRETLAEWQRVRQEREMRAFGVLIGTDSGAGELAAMTDAMVTLRNLGEDNDALSMMFSI